MRRKAGPARKRVLRAKRQAVPGVKRRIKAQTVEFAVFGDSHVGYGNSLSIFKSLLPKAVSNGNKRFIIFGEIIPRRERITGITLTPTIRTSRIQ